jgi:ADP-ribosylglycohydrolase
VGEPVTIADRITGSLLAGAVGDALGGAVEFDSIATIHERFGTGGITDMAPAYGLVGAITDDTQMTLFTAEGVIRAHLHRLDGGGADRVSFMHQAYLRWLYTQEDDGAYLAFAMPEGAGWLAGLTDLYSRRAPGMTCLSALRATASRGIGEPINDSKGCGGVMRVAPIGLAVTNPEDAFRYRCEAAAITHSHPTGYLAAGFLAAVISRIMAGNNLVEAIVGTLDILRGWETGDETERAVLGAMELAEHGDPSPENVERLGAGWIAEEALAIRLYCAMIAENLEQVLILAVNHSGDSDSTGSIAGNIAGAILGQRAIPDRWLTILEMREVTETITGDLYRLFHQSGYSPTEMDFQRYPLN